LSFRSAPLSREESAFSLPAENRFLADKPGFGMTVTGNILAAFIIAICTTENDLWQHGK
jgi:hypothetical protein